MGMLMGLEEMISVSHFLQLKNTIPAYASPIAPVPDIPHARVKVILPVHANPFIALASLQLVHYTGYKFGRYIFL